MVIGELIKKLLELPQDAVILRRDTELGLIEVTGVDPVSVRRFSGPHSSWYSNERDGGEGGMLYRIHVDANGPQVSDPLDAIAIG